MASTSPLIARSNLNSESFSKYSGLSRVSNAAVPASSPGSVPAASGSYKPLSIRNARGTQKFSGGESPKPKPKFGTVFFRAESDDEEEGGAKPGGLALKPVAFTGVQLFNRLRPADENSVFVANADGKTGARITLELLRDGFKVRAGVQDLGEAQQLAKFAAEYGIISSQEAKRLNVVEFSIEDPVLVAKSIGSAAKVVITIGESENGPSGKVTPQDAAKIVEAAELAKISNLVIVAPLDGSQVLQEGPAGFIAKIFSLFSGRKADSKLTFDQLLDKIVETDLKYTVIQTTDSSDVPDSFAATSGILIGAEGSEFIGKISKIQVASVVATALSNVTAAENKVFQVSASLEAPATSVVELLGAIAEDTRRAELAEQKAREAVEEEARKAAEEAREALLAAERLELEAKKLAAEEARAAALAGEARARAVSFSESVSELTAELKAAAGGDLKTRLGRIAEKASPENRSFTFPKFDEEQFQKAFNFSGFASKINLPKFPESSADEEEKPAPAPKSSRKPKKSAASSPAPKAKGKKSVQETFYVDEEAGDF